MKPSTPYPPCMSQVIISTCPRSPEEETLDGRNIFLWSGVSPEETEASNHEHSGVWLSSSILIAYKCSREEMLRRCPTQDSKWGDSCPPCPCWEAPSCTCDVLRKDSRDFQVAPVGSLPGEKKGTVGFSPYSKSSALQANQEVFHILGPFRLLWGFF